jgi:hypothetical protein
MRIQNTLRATQRESYWLTQGEAKRIGCFPVWRIFCCSRNIMEVPNVALCAFKCLGNCSVRIQNISGADLFYHIGA